MNYKIEYRRYKIAKFFNKPFNKRDEEYFIFIKDNLVGLNRYINGFEICYGKSEQDIKMYFNTKSNYMMFDSDIWEYFEKIYFYQEIKELTEQILEYHYGYRNISTTRESNITRRYNVLKLQWKKKK